MSSITLAGAAPAAVVELPLSGTQAGIWLADQISTSDNGYVVAHWVDLQGAVDLDCLAMAIRRGLAEADTLHARFDNGDAGVVQRLATVDVADIAAPKIIDLRAETQPLQAALAFMQADLAQPLRADTDALLYRHVLLRLADERCCWYQRYHHICVDGYSFSALTRRMAAIYASLRRGETPPQCPFVPFAEVIAEAQRHAASAAGARDAEFWRDYGASLAAPVSLSTRDAAAATDFANVDVLRERLQLPVPVLAADASLRTPGAVELGMAAVLAYLHRLSGEERIVVGLPFMRRLGSVALDAIGPVVNVLPVQAAVDEGLTLVELAQRFSAEIARVRRHQRRDAEQVQRDLGLSGSGRTLYGPTLNLKIYEQALDFAGARGQTHVLAAGHVDDLEFGLWQQGDELVLEISANPARYDSDELRRHAQRLEIFCGALLSEPGRALAQATLLAPAERAQIEQWSRGPDVAVPAGVNSVLDLLRQQVSAQGEATALVCAGQQTSYAALWARSRQIAQALRRRGVGRGDIVALALPRDASAVIALFGVLAAGAAYLPLDLEYPRERLALICADARARLALIHSTLRDHVPESVDLLCLDTLPLPAAESDQALDIALQPDDAAYVIYTSGSTGTPKGVIACHGGLLNLVLSHRAGMFGQALLDVQGRRLRAAHTTSFAFDASWEQLCWLLLGQELHLCDDELRRDAAALALWVREHQIDALDLPPALLAPLLAQGLLQPGAQQPCLILTGSEAVPAALWRELHEQTTVRVYNCYGPTEYTVDALVADVATSSRPLIGRPVANSRARVLDAALRPQPVGVAGELYLSGPGLARAYLGQPALTAGRFVADPEQPGARMYRSGDRVRWRSDGQLEFLGRSDNQVKIRGFRVELGEVEHALCALPGVSAAVVVAEAAGGSQRLLAYCTVHGAEPLPNSESLLQGLARRLPDYMLPAALAVLPQWPLNINGKIDRRALPPITQRRSDAPRPAATPAERLICAGIAQVLQLAAVSAGEDFFALGGDSISAMALGTQLRRDGFRLAPRDIFAQRTPARMAALLQPVRETAAAAEVSGALGRLPMLAWFEHHYGLQARYAQGVVAAIPETVEFEHIAHGIQAVQRAHPALRARTESGMLVAGAATRTGLLQRVELEPHENLAQAATQQFQQAAQRLDPAAGRLLQAVLLHSADQRHLLLAVHHLAVDGVSWRVLLEELATACTAAAAGTAALILPEETSLAAWAAALAADMPRRRDELEFWRETLQQPLPLPGITALQPGRDTYGRAGQRRSTLDSGLTTVLLRELPQAYQAGIEEVLLAAVARSCSAVWKSEKLRFALESHGREGGDALDLARTVGWLTAEYPVLVDLADAADHAGGSVAAVRAVKQSLRRIPDRGLGYATLRWLDTEGGTELAVLESAQRPQILFNYLGRFAHGDAAWTPQRLGGSFADAFAVDMAPDMPLLHALEINIFVDETSAGPQLAVNWTWAVDLIDAALIDRLHDGLAAQMQAFAAFAADSPQAAADTLVAADTLAASGRALQASQLAALRRRHGATAAVLPVLPLQQGLLFHAQLGEAASKYNSISRMDFRGCLDSARLRGALQAVLRRHPQLAAAFELELDAEPLQLLPLATPEWPWRECTLTATDAATVAQQLRELERNELDGDFRIGQPDCGPLLQALLVHHGEDEHSLFVTAHHLVVDGWSTPILLQDLLQAYAADTPQLPPTRTQYTSVVRALAARDLTAARSAWRDALAGVTPTLLFDASSAGAVQEIEIVLPAALEQALVARGREHGLTLNSLLQGAWAALLACLSGRDDVVFGAPVSGRFSPVDGIGEHIGLFSNTLPVRLRLQPQLPLLEQIATLQAQQIGLLEHDGLGLAEIQHLAGAGNLFDTLLVSENYPDDRELFRRDYHGARLSGLRNRGYTHYPLTVLLLPGEQLRLIVEYRAAVREPAQLVQRLMGILEHLAHDAQRPWSQFDARLPQEIALIDRINATAQPLPATTLCALIQAQVLRSPDAIALQDEATRLSYAQMQRQLDALCARLQAAGVQRGDIVAVALPRSVYLSLALGAVLQAGAAYLPLDTGYPDERLGYMIADAKPRLIITDSGQVRRFGALGEVLLLDALAADSAPVSAGIAPKPHDAAYLLYTSGSTGRPKGVLVSHQAIVNRLLWMQHEYGLAADDCVLQKTPCSFDVSVWEFFWPLLTGARLFLAPPEAHREPEQLLRLIAEQQVTTLHFVPSMLAAFVEHVRQTPGAAALCNRLRRVFCSGEALSRELAQAWAACVPAPLHNLYGPTEAAVDVTYKPAADDDAGTRMAASVPIGRPVWNTQLRLLDASLRPVPPGVPGELYLTGVQLADGYLGRPDLTASRFVADPQGQGERMYRTGDVARWLPNGDVEYLGRSDDQLKIRGQRIELGEIEAALLAQVGVQRAVVHAQILGSVAATTAGADARQLVGYVIADGVIAEAALLAALAQRLPAHMLPVAIVQLEQFPLSANGKLERKALPPPAVQRSAGRAPRSGLESHVAAAFARVLGVVSVQAEDDFFALGGHSLLAMRLAAELRRELERPVSVGQIMVTSSVAGLAALLGDAAAAGDPSNAGLGEVLPLRRGGGRRLFCIHPASGFAWQYAGLARHLPADLELIGLQSPRPAGAIAASADMDAVCEQHLATLRRLQPRGPYRLLGYSLGGTIAQGLAQRLQVLGEEVAFLGLLDTYPPEGQDWSGPTDSEAQAEVEREQSQFMAAAEDAEDAFVQREKAAMFDQVVANYQDAVRLLAQARTPRFDGTAHLFVATRTLPPGWDVRASWAAYLAALQVYELDCSHEDILDPAGLAVLGARLGAALDAAG